MEQKTLEMQTAIYLYDLANIALEHGFKGDDHWDFSMVSENESKVLMREFYPSVALKVLPETLLKVYHSIKSKQQQSNSREDHLPEQKHIMRENLNHIVAFNVKRPRH